VTCVLDPKKRSGKRRIQKNNLAKTKSGGGAQLKTQLTALCEFPHAIRLRNPDFKTGGFSAES